MERDTIAVVEIDEAGQLHVVPSNHSFPYIYREGMEVGWDPERRSLHSPRPREWSYARWYEQILAAAREQGWDLSATASTRWVNVEPGVKAMFLQFHGQGA